MAAPLPASTAYLFQSAGVDSNLPVEVFLGRHALAVRNQIREWWQSLEPELTSGVSVDRLEEALGAFAEEAVLSRHRRCKKSWAISWFNWKPGFTQSDAEKAVGLRFLRATERLGILSVGERFVTFAHPYLFELYLGIKMSKQRGLPTLVKESASDSATPLEDPRGRAVLVRLALTPEEELGSAFQDVAKENLMLASWYLYANPSARDQHGEWLAREVLDQVGWENDAASRSRLRGCLESLSRPGLSACRRLIASREAKLPGLLMAISHVAQRGDEEDLPHLQAIVSSENLGNWEIEQLRQHLRDCEALVSDEENQKRYTRAQIIEGAKLTAALALKIGGTVATKTAKLPGEWRKYEDGFLANTAADGLANLPEGNFYQHQQFLRQQIAELPDLIERRKKEVASTAPSIRLAAQEAIQHLTRGG